MPTLPTMTTKKLKIKGKILEILRVFTIREFFAYHEFSIVDFAYQDFSGELRACFENIEIPIYWFKNIKNDFLVPFFAECRVYTPVDE